MIKDVLYSKEIISFPRNRSVYYYMVGKGEPLLFFHSVLGFQLKGFLAHLAKSYRVIAPFAPGWGPAKEQLEYFDEGPLDITLHNADFMELMDLSSAHLVGMSIGAWMAAELAAMFPQKVRSLILVNPVGIWRDEFGGEDLFAQHPGSPSKILFANSETREKVLFEGKDKLEAKVSEIMHLKAAAKFLWPIPDTGVHRRLHRIRAKTLVVTSEEDTVVPMAYGMVWRNAILGARLEKLQNASHLADLDEPVRLGDIVVDFLGDISDAA